MYSDNRPIEDGRIKNPRLDDPLRFDILNLISIMFTSVLMQHFDTVLFAIDVSMLFSCILVLYGGFNSL